MNHDAGRLQVPTHALEGVAVLVAQVQAIDRHHSGPMVVQLDRRIDDLPFAWPEARLLSRRSRSRLRLTLLVRRPSRVDIVLSDDVVAVRLPGDLHMGDLLALPARTTVAVDAVRRALS